MKKVVFGALALASAAGFAVAAPRESVTFTSVNSIGAVDAADNVVQTNTFTGGYAATAVGVTGTLTEVDVATYGSEARIRVTDSNGGATVVQPFTTAGFTGSITIPAGLILDLSATDANADGQWSFRFYESFVDNDPGLADATWDTITFTLDDRAGIDPDAATFVETEDNNTKANATAANGLVPGNTLGGRVVTGNPDYFKIKAAAAAPAIYEYTLALRGTGVTGDVRGLTITASQPVAGTDVAIGAGTTVRWYGFGLQEELYWRASTTSTTEASYVAQVTRATVTPVDLGNLSVGDISVVPDTATSTAFDTDWIVYDQNFNPVSTFQHDDIDTTVITRNLQAGTYYIAGGRYNTCNDQPSPADDTFTFGAAMDFPNVVHSSAGTSTTDYGITVSNSSAGQSFTGVWTADFAAGQVAWFKFTVGSGNSCVADFTDAGGSGTPDGGVTIEDLLFYLDIFSQGVVRADVDNGTGTGTTDGGVAIEDLLYFLQRFADGC